MVLQVAKDIFTGIEFRSVGRKRLQLEPTVLISDKDTSRK